MSFDKLIYLCNHRSHQDTEHFCHSRKLSFVPFHLIPYPSSPNPIPLNQSQPLSDPHPPSSSQPQDLCPLDSWSPLSNQAGRYLYASSYAALWEASAFMPCT